VASELFLSVFSPSAFSAPSAVKSFRCNRKRYQYSTITDGTTGIEPIHLRDSVFICPHLRFKKENVLTADDKGLTRIHADEEFRS
ncbi:hypothetical protein, partial [Microcoleus sp. D2_18a_D3]|uniref:hypothetical protein n=1 Tax=Microcoleus sp. D2_18a_D3 TaxID=3055330 RepID=UPI002FD5560D